MANEREEAFSDYMLRMAEARYKTAQRELERAEKFLNRAKWKVLRPDMRIKDRRAIKDKMAEIEASLPRLRNEVMFAEDAIKRIRREHQR